MYLENGMADERTTRTKWFEVGVNENGDHGFTTLHILCA
jgi:hypothetical protein